METIKQTPDLKQAELPEALRPYVKPAVERVALSEARANLTQNIVAGDLVSISS
jgi:hypothetical protein